MGKKVTFTVYDDVGATLGTIDITGHIVYGTDFYASQVNQVMIKTADNETRVRGNDLLSYTGTLVVTAVGQTEGEAFKAFVANIMQHQARYIGISTTCPYVNLGVGIGNPLLFVNKVRYQYNNSQGLEKFKAPGLFDFKFDYLFKIPV